MSRQQIVRKAGWLVGVLVAVVVVAVFARVRNHSPSSAPISGTGPASLDNIVNSRQSWDVAFESWSGKAAPDFVVNDINGQTHSVRDYRGKNMLVVFWATWCPACKLEIPHLIELRKLYNEDELGILAISNESPEDLKQFAAAKGINYSVASLGSAPLPAPFSGVTSIPTTFFIGRDGTIKLTALGLVSLEESKAIIKAGQ